jgi:hypothetical protein
MASVPKIDHKDVRVNFKDSLFSLFMHFSGLQGDKSRVFGINNPTEGGVHILIFASCLRLDLANHTVVLDSAVLPLTNRLMPKIDRFLAALSSSRMGLPLCNIKVDNDELSLWKEVLPAMVERCRRWEHRSSCEYVVKGQIPLSVEEGKRVLCSCGEGLLPAKFVTGVPEWEVASKYAVRAAISPSFSVPFVEKTFDFDSIKSRVQLEIKRCHNCRKEKCNDGTNLLTCSRCQVVKYCSAQCQRDDWREHKKVCGKGVAGL